MEFIEEQAFLFSDLAEEYRNFGQLYTKKYYALPGGLSDVIIFIGYGIN